MYKLGDKFEVVVARVLDGMVAVGDIVTLTVCEGGCGGKFRTKDNEEFVAEFEGAGIGMTRVVRPYRTEAEKRGAKFGDIGSLKGSVTKFTFLSDALEKNGFGEALWSVGYESGEVCHLHPSNIRLDHEPEYKEIPFSEATHEQRMDVGNLWYADSPVVRIVHFYGSGYAFTITSDFEIRTDTSLLTVRIPA